MPGLHEPVPAEPFLNWFQRRLDYYDRVYGKSDIDGGRNMWRVLDEIGWPHDSGARRMYRLRNESLTGMMERATVEDALHRAGVLVSDLYPDLPEPEPMRERPAQRRMTDEQVLAAHRIYVGMKLTQRTLAELLWEKYGYENMNACAKAIAVAFRSFGLQPRRCTATTAAGKRCTGAPVQGDDVCALHDPRRASKRSAAAKSRPNRMFVIPDDVLMEARVMRHAWGMSWLGIAQTLLSETPYEEPGWFAKRLAREVGDQRLYVKTGDDWERVA